MAENGKSASIDPLNKLCKWRSVLAGWITGTRMINSGDGVKGWRDLMDARLMTRVECSALAHLLIEKGVFTHEEFSEACYHEAELLDALYEKRFKGMRTDANGVVVYDLRLAQQTMHELGFPP